MSNSSEFNKEFIEVDDIDYKTIFDFCEKKGFFEENKNYIKQLGYAFRLAKTCHSGILRRDGTRYFEHLKDVTLILIKEFENVTFNMIIIALLHDILEDTSFSKNTLEIMFSKEIADNIDNLSKKDRQEYLTIKERKKLKDNIDYSNLEERKIYAKIKSDAKNRLYEDYYSKLPKLDDDSLLVKFIDRIHALRTLRVFRKEKIIRKIEETERFFLDIARKRNPKAYSIMIEEIRKIQIFLEEKEVNKSKSKKNTNSIIRKNTNEITKSLSSNTEDSIDISNGKD